MKIELSEFIIYIFLPIILLTFILLLYKKYMREQKSLMSDYIYTLNLLELTYMYNGKITKKDIKAYIIFLINKNYLKIDHKNNLLIKLKNSNDDMENQFINSIFKENNTINLNELNILTVSDNFLNTVKIKNEINNVFDEKKLSKKTIVKMIIVLIFMTVMFKISYDIKNIILVFLIIFSFIGMKIFVETVKSKKIKIRIIGSIIGAFMMTIPVFLISSQITNIYYLFIYVIGLLLIIIMIVIDFLMPKNKTLKKNITNELDRLKEYIISNSIYEIIKKDKIYYYKILPYAYVINLDNELYEIGKKLKIENIDEFNCLDDLTI